MRGFCPVWPWLVEFNGAVLSCLTLSGSIVLMEVWLISREHSPIPLYSVSGFAARAGGCR